MFSHERAAQSQRGLLARLAHAAPAEESIESNERRNPERAVPAGPDHRQHSEAAQELEEAIRQATRAYVPRGEAHGGSSVPPHELDEADLRALDEEDPETKELPRFPLPPGPERCNELVRRCKEILNNLDLWKVSHAPDVTTHADSERLPWARCVPCATKSTADTPMRI